MLGACWVVTQQQVWPQVASFQVFRATCPLVLGVGLRVRPGFLLRSQFGSDTPLTTSTPASALAFAPSFADLSSWPSRLAYQGLRRTSRRPSPRTAFHELPFPFSTAAHGAFCELPGSTGVDLADGADRHGGPRGFYASGRLFSSHSLPAPPGPPIPLLALLPTPPPLPLLRPGRRPSLRWCRSPLRRGSSGRDGASPQPGATGGQRPNRGQPAPPS
jgi:hypothetical protein